MSWPRAKRSRRYYADEVLARPRFGFDPGSVGALLDYLEFAGEKVAAAPLQVRLPDPDDESFLEVALASSAECLVTGNIAHFPEPACLGARVLSPAQFMEAYRGLP